MQTKEEKLAYQREWARNNKEKRAASHKRYCDKNPEKRIAKDKAYRENNKEKVAERQKAYQKAYNEKNKEKVAAMKRAYNARNKEARAAAKKAYYEKNKEKRAAQDKAYRAKNRDRRTAMNNKRYAEDPSYRVAIALRGAAHRIIGRQGTGEIELRVGFTKDDFVSHLSLDHYYDKWIDDPAAYHLDHIIPVSAYGKLTWEHADIKKVCNPRNLQILPAEENLRKSDKVDYALIEAKGITDLLPQALLSAS